MTVVDLSFPLTGSTIPTDHGWLVYEALRRHAEVPLEVAIHPIAGRPVPGRRLALHAESRLAMRLPLAVVERWRPVGDRPLQIGQDEVALGEGRMQVLEPASRLSSRLVLIKDAMEPDLFLSAAHTLLQELDIEARLTLRLRQGETSLEQAGDNRWRCPYVRRTINIKGREMVGYALDVDGLQPEASLRLQQSGLGLGRVLGCGVFVPTRPLTRALHPLAA
ncbi:MAG: type I-MYXAN CRISPR-associated protein Cas6/Cmx6 [Candidatus Xenobia bacterium]